MRDASNEAGGASNFPRIVPLGEAAVALGYPTADALRRAFDRNLIPQRFLIRLGKRTVRVDLPPLVAFLREQAAAREVERQ